MTKLLQLRDWIIVAQSTNHISALVGEPVTEMDVFRLAIDRKLVLSVIFVEGTAQRGQYTSDDYDESKEGHAFWIEYGGPFFDLRGIYDLYFFGGELMDQEVQFQLLDERITSMVKAEAFALTDYDDGGEQFFYRPRFEPQSGAADTFATRSHSGLDSVLYKLGLPESCRFALKTAELRAFEQRISNTAQIEPLENPLSKKERTNLQSIIGGLLGLLLYKGPAGTAKPAFAKQEAIIQELIRLHNGVGGFSESNLESVFAKANRILHPS